MGRELRAERQLTRAGFGPRPGELAQLRGGDDEAWLAAQLAAANDLALERRLTRFARLDLAPGDASPDLRRPARGARRELSAEQKQVLREATREFTRDVIGARIVRAVHGRQQLREGMIDFWSNHFSVFARKGPVATVLPHYQREVIEPHALGRFGDLLLATARSPAMLFYLDNWLSTAPRGGRRRPRRAGGINENYARELLELHTLGVDGGYSQADVREVARVFTGWTVESRERPSFRFRERIHDAGPKTVLGLRVRGDGVEQGERLLERLARHPSTATFVSRKLARRFVGDRPPEALVDRLARRFLETEGDLRELLSTLFRSPEFVDPELRKLKTPFRYAVSALRATGGECDGAPPALRAIGRLGELPYTARTPAGFPEDEAHWVGPAATLERMGLAFALAAQRVRGARLGSEWPEAAPAPIAGLRGAEGVAVALASPEFQWT